MSVNINTTSSGAQPTTPASIRERLLAMVSATVPGYTADLPGSLIEDISSTQIAGLVLMDSAAVDLINSMTPQTMNDYLLGLLASVKGIVPGQSTNASAYLTFIGFAGTVIPKGFIVSNGQHQFTVQSAAVLANAVQAQFTASIAGNVLTVTAVAAGQLMVGDPVTGAGVAANTMIVGVGTGTGGIGTYILNNAQTVASEPMIGATHGTANVYVVATDYWTDAVLPNTITTIASPKPSGYPLFCTNPNTGIPATGAETSDILRARVLDAEKAPATGQTEYVKSLIRAVPGVQYRLVSLGGNGKIIVGGGDPYLVAQAIYNGLLDIGDFQGSSVHSHNWTANATIAGYEMTLSGVSGGSVSNNDIVQGVGVINPTIITGQISGTPGGNGVYQINYEQSIISPVAVSGAGSLRNEIVSIVSYPDRYWIVYVIPISQTVNIDITWSTTASNFTANVAVQDLVANAMSGYINSIAVGNALNTNVLTQIFNEAIASLIDPSLISVMTMTIKINGSVVTPTPGTVLIPGDTEGYFVTLPANITLTRQ